MIALTDRDRLIVLALLFRVPLLWEGHLARLWPGTDSGLENMRRRLGQLCAEGLVARHTVVAQASDEVDLFYHWAPDMLDPNFGSLAWELAKRWEALEPRRVTFYVGTEHAAKHFGRTVKSPLKSASAASHDVGLGGVFVRYALEHPLLAGAWVSEDVIAAARGHGEKVVDACVVDSTSTPALAVEFAGASYHASNGERLREIHADCLSRRLPYEMWTVALGESK